MKSRQPILIGIFIAALVISLIWYFVMPKNSSKNAASTETATTETTAETKVSNLSNLDPADFDTAVKNEYAAATAKATAASAQNKLASIEIDIDENLAADSVSTRYVYAAANDTLNNWIITFAAAGDTFVRALIPKEDYLGDIQAMNTKLWKYNYVTALQLAEKNGGLTWRESNKLKGVHLSLKHSGAKNWLLWIVEYQGESESYIIKLDANAGKVVTE